MQNSQALSAEPESALGYRACHHRDNRILDPPRLPFALKTGIVVSGNFKWYLAFHLCEVGRGLVPDEGAACFGGQSFNCQAPKQRARRNDLCVILFVWSIFRRSTPADTTYEKIQWWVCGTRFSATLRPCPCPCHPQSAFSPSDPCRPEQPNLFG
jgi:hypothetical protein